MKSNEEPEAGTSAFKGNFKCWFAAQALLESFDWLGIRR
jgi:hypothetical protein